MVTGPVLVLAKQTHVTLRGPFTHARKQSHVEVNLEGGLNNSLTASTSTLRDESIIMLQHFIVERG